MSWDSYSPREWPTPPARPVDPYATPVVVRVYRSRQARRSPLSTLITLWLIGLLLSAVALTALAGAFYGYFQTTDRIVPGVRLGEVSLGGMTLEEAYAAAQQTQVGLQNSPLQVTDGDQSHTLTAAELGFEVDAIQSVLQAHAVGHNGPILDEAAQMGSALWNGRQIEPVVYLNLETARARLAALAPAMNRAPVDAGLRLENGALTTTPAQPGAALDIEATLAQLVARQSEVFSQKALTVVTRPVAPRITDVSAALAQAQRLMDTPQTVAAFDPIRGEYLSWSPGRETVATWLQVLPGENGPRVSFDPNPMNTYLQQLSAGLGQERYLEIGADPSALAAAAEQGQPIWAQVKHRPTTYTVQPGDTLLKIGWNLGMPYWRIAAANPDVDPDRLRTGMELAIPSKDDLLPLPVVANKRIVISISAQRLWAFQDGKLLREEVISTGIDRSPTQPGVFQVQTHDPNAYASIWDLYMPNWLGIYEAWPGFMNGIHGLPLLSNGRRLWAGSLGKPASYGCIILDLPAAEWLYNWAENGVVVEIQP